MELRNMLLLETLYVEFLDREISSMEAENKRVQNIVTEYLRVVEQLERWKSQNGLLQRKVKRLLRKTNCQTEIIREKDLKIEAKDSEIRRNDELLQGRSNVIKKLEDEVRELKSFTDQLQQQKHELSEKLELAENSHSSISKVCKFYFQALETEHFYINKTISNCDPTFNLETEERIKIKDYNQLANEYEQVQKDRATELKELIYLRWCNACLRYELKRNQMLQKNIQENKDHLEQEFEECGEIAGFRIEQQLDGLALMEKGEPCLGAITGAQVGFKRQKLLKKFKKWVEGSEKMKPKLDAKEKHESKCFGRQSVADEVQGQHLVHARKSCSTV